MNRFVRLVGFLFGLTVALFICACGGGSQGSGGTHQNPATPGITVSPASSTVTTAQALTVTIAVSGSSGTPAGSVALSSLSYASNSVALNAGSASITIPAGSLATGADTLTAQYTPDSASAAVYASASGTASVTVTQAPTTPSVTVTPASGSITTAQSLAVTIAVSGASGTPTGSVVLSSHSYSSSTVDLKSGSASITIPAGSLAIGADNLTAAYTPDAASSAVYTGNCTPITQAQTGTSRTSAWGLRRMTQSSSSPMSRTPAATR